jgi:hypothetical protein
VQVFERDSRAWGLKRSQALGIAVIPIGIVLGMIALVPFFYVFLWLTAEDSAIEWAQFLMLLLAGLVFAWLGLRFLRGSQPRFMGALYLLVALGLFFIAGEEIAWGQRILGLETPARLEEINAQGEITFHNISWAHQIFIYAVMLCGMYGSLIPFVRLFVQGERRTALSYLFVPPLCLVPAFIMPFGYRLSRLLFPLEEWFPRLIFPITKISEVTEVCLYFGVLAFAWLNVRRLFQEQKAYRLVRGIERDL